MKSVLPHIAVVLFSLSWAVHGQGYNVNSGNFPPLPTARTTPFPRSGLTTKQYYYDQRAPAGAAHAITDSPLAGKHLPANTVSAVHGSECTIFSDAYPDQYLTMASGYFHYYPELKKGNPKAVAGSWDWTGVWKITYLTVQGRTHFQLFNLGTNNYLTFNETKHEFVRGTTKADYVANLWDITEHFKAGGPSYKTIQHSQPPKGYLHALTSNKKSDTRPVGILALQPGKDIYHWKVTCGT
ncbi:uncharacterized protein LOC132200958 [Neocloeon triangulifer]|uniref:uncharacterized protein LOC132200958 n=1 Tax=Neocloeon triangulifer TaxID=2078957 RepID=UPI00286F7FC2|nr:uncharacterized protein LOC132200958 [Neocloeon triangulifer]